MSVETLTWKKMPDAGGWWWFSGGPEDQEKYPPRPIHIKREEFAPGKVAYWNFGPTWGWDLIHERSGWWAGPITPPPLTDNHENEASVSESKQETTGESQIQTYNRMAKMPERPIDLGDGRVILIQVWETTADEDTWVDGTAKLYLRGVVSKVRQ